MFKTIVRKEILENISSYRFPLFALICLTLVPLSLYVNHVEYAKRLRDYGEQMRLADEAGSSMTMRDLMAGTVAMKGFRRPALLSLFSQGLESAMPRFYEFTQDGVKPGESSSGDESVLSVQGKVDFVFLVQMVLSLIGLLYASDMISGEKETGTLRAMLSNRLPRDTILTGKIAGGYLALWLPFVLSFLLGAFLLLPGSFPFFSGDAPARIAAILLATSLFLLIYYILGLAVSTSSAKSRTSAMAILLIWAFFQLIAPKLSGMIASVVHPVRTETAVSLEKSLLTKSIDTETAKELGRQYELILGAGHRGTDADMNTPEYKKWDAAKSDIEQQARNRKAQEIGRIDETYQQEKRRQQTLAVDISLISPSAAFARLIADICGTGEVERTKYMEAVLAYQKALDNELFSKIKRTIMIYPSGGTGMGFQALPVDFKKLPKFSMTSSTLAEAVKANGNSLASLVFWLVAPFAIAYVRFLKYDVR